MCMRGRERQTENGKVSQKATFMKNRVHTVISHPENNSGADWISVVIAHGVLFPPELMKSSRHQAESQRNKKHVNGIENILCGPIRNVCQLISSVSQYHWPQRMFCSETLHQLSERFEPVPFCIVWLNPNRYVYYTHRTTLVC